ncbi:hypothetical protein V6N13_059486 [Hibiscus sabdariffa]
MEAEWHRITDSAQTPLPFVDKLRSMKAFLKVWNRESFGSVDLQIETTTELLNDFEEGGMGDVGPEEFEGSRCKLQGNLLRLLKHRSSIWRQKLRISWLREGDRNTRFFQQATKLRGMRNLIQGLWVNGRWVTSPALLKHYVCRFFCVHFSQRPIESSFEQIVHLARLSEDYQTGLEVPFTENEIWEACFCVV